MACPVYIARCRNCGNARRTYNDPRLGRSVIECKAACYESHYEWDFVEECNEEEKEKKEAETSASNSAIETTTASALRKRSEHAKKRKKISSKHCTMV